MATLSEQIADALRDFNTDGVPASGEYDPEKSKLRATLINMATAISAAQQGMASYATVADLPTDPVPAEGTQARVYADETETNNGVWIYKDSAWAFDQDYYDAVASVVQPLVDSAAESAADAEAAVSVNRIAIDGNLANTATFGSQIFNGATRRNDDDDRRTGLSIPSGATGVNSLVQATIPIDGAALTGISVDVVVQVDTSVPFDRTIGWALQILVGGSILSRSVTSQSTVTVAGRTTITRRYTFVGDESAIMPYVQIQAGDAAAEDQWLEVTGVALHVAASPDVLTPADRALGLTLERERARTVSQVLTGRPTEVTVKPSGGDYDDIADAIAAITDASAAHPYLVKIWPSDEEDGSWSVNELTPAPYVGLKGVGPDRVWLKGYQEPSTSLADVAANSALRWNSEGSLRNLKITAQNMRYVIHADAAGMTNATLKTINCWFEHFGNQEVIDYQAANGGAPDSVWSGWEAWGSGTWPGGKMLHVDTVFRSPLSAYLAHNTSTGNPQTDAAYIDLDACLVEFDLAAVTEYASASALPTDPVPARLTRGLVTDDPDPAKNGLWAVSSAGAWIQQGVMQLQSFGTGQTDVCRLVGNAFNGPVSMMIQAGTEKNWLVTGRGNSGLSFIGAAVRQQTV